MRDYPSVPNVFRVASSLSVNNEGNNCSNANYATAATTTTAVTSAAAVEVRSTANACKTKAIQVQQQQQKRLHQNLQQQNLKQHQQQNGSINIQQQHQQQQQQQRAQVNPAAPPSTAQTTKTITTTPATGSSAIVCGNTTEANAQQYNGTVIMHNNKLTTTASIERNYQNGNKTSGPYFDQQQQQQYSPYATLPRTISAYTNATASAFQQSQKQQQQQQQQQQQRQHTNGNGVINTISGSIPATGFVNGRATSVGSDLNMSLNNSCMDLSKMNGFQKQQQHQKQQQQQEQEQELPQQQKRDFQIAHRSSINNNYPKRMSAAPCTRLEHNNSSYLCILTPVAASISVAIVIAALAGPQWLFTEEKLPNANYNGTANFNVMDDGAFITKYTKSSLWILCTTLHGVETYNCIKIDYFPREGYQPDPHDSTPAIPYTVTKSCPFFLASGIFLLISFIVFLIPTCSHQNNLYYFSAGIMFIVSGLLMLIGLIAYISILKAEIGSKLRSRSQLQPALFKVTYGQSFFLFVFGFIATEFVGLLNIFLYISLQGVGYYSRLPCFTISNIQQKIREGVNPRNHTYKSYNHLMDVKSMRYTNNHQVHDVHLPSASSSSAMAGATTTTARTKLREEMELDSKKLMQQMSAFTCRKHPNNEMERRFYLENAPLPKCNLHSKNLTKSLNELYTEPAPTICQPPPPPSATLPRSQYSSSHFADLPQEFPLTRSVSTTTDIYNSNQHGNGNENGKGNGDRNSRSGTTPHVERKGRRNMATNTITRPSDTDTNKNDAHRRSTPMKKKHEMEDDMLYDEEQQTLCGLKRGVRKTKDEFFQEFCRRAGMRPKPKNIYYIGDEEDEIEQQHKAPHKQQQQQPQQQQQRRRFDGIDIDERNNLNLPRNTQVEHAFLGETDDEQGFKQLQQEQEEHIYVIKDNAQFLAHPMRNMRRSSMYVEPTHLRKLNSNLSLHSLYPPADKIYQKNLLDLERCDSSVDIWPQYPDSSLSIRDSYGGSQNRLQNDYNSHIYQSRTLPRSFLKRSTESQDNLGSASLHASATALHNAYSASQNRLTNLALYPQQLQPLQPQNRFLSLSRDGEIYHSHLALNKSNEEDVTLSYNRPPITNLQYATTPLNLIPCQQQPTSVPPQHQHQQPQSQPIICSNNNSNVLRQPIVQWPAAIPSSPLNFPAKYQIYSNNPHVPHLGQHNLISRSSSSGGASNGPAAAAANVCVGPAKFQRGYAFDEQRRSSAIFGDAFDLDEMERERRRSHASLFSGTGGNNSSTEHYDLINGTAV